jgi:hypothetical protein
LVEIDVPSQVENALERGGDLGLQMDMDHPQAPPVGASQTRSIATVS